MVTTAAAGTNTSFHVIPGLEVARALAHRLAIPAASWPSTIGVGRGREPSITEQDLQWRRPAAAILTRTSAPARGAEVELHDFRAASNGRRDELEARLAKNGGLDAHGDHGRLEMEQSDAGRDRRTGQPEKSPQRVMLAPRMHRAT